jgi:hypothetical protein
MGDDELREVLESVARAARWTGHWLAWRGVALAIERRPVAVATADLAPALRRMGYAVVVR